MRLSQHGKKLTRAERAGSFCALNPLTAAVLGMLFLGERPGLPGFVGAALILAGILLQKLPERRAKAAPIS